MILHIATGAVPIFENSDASQVPRLFDELGGHIADPHQMVDQTGRSGALRHAAQRRVIEARLREGETAMRLYRPYPDGPAAAVPERMMPTAFSPWLSPSDVKNESIG